MSFGCDNANVMVGKTKGVHGRLCGKGDIFLANCTLHLIHKAAEKAAEVLPTAVEEILVDIHFYLKKSSKRQDELSSFQELHNLDQRKMLKHVCTRWLSIDRCLERLLTSCHIRVQRPRKRGAYCMNRKGNFQYYCREFVMMKDALLMFLQVYQIQCITIAYFGRQNFFRHGKKR
jgi:hypothetical protein